MQRNTLIRLMQLDFDYYVPMATKMLFGVEKPGPYYESTDEPWTMNPDIITISQIYTEGEKGNKLAMCPSRKHRSLSRCSVMLLKLSIDNNWNFQQIFSYCENHRDGTMAICGNWANICLNLRLFSLIMMEICQDIICQKNVKKTIMLSGKFNLWSKLLRDISLSFPVRLLAMIFLSKQYFCSLLKWLSYISDKSRQ